MAAPSFILQGTGVSVQGGASVPWPAGHQADDIGVLMVQTANQAVTTPTGWTLLTSTGTGTAGAAGSCALYVYWKRATTSAETDAAVTDVGDHIRSRMLLFRGCETSGSPFSGTSVTGITPTATAVSIAMPTTADADCYCVGIVANATDTTGNQTTVPSWINAGLVGFTRIANANTDVGVGGGIDAGGGTKAVAGAVGNCTATLSIASNQAKVGFALKPPGVPPVEDVTNGGIYVATGVKATAGATGTTTATMDNAGIQARLTFALKPPTAPPVDLPPVVDPLPAIIGAINTLVQFPIVAADPEGEALDLELTAGDSSVPTGAVILEDDTSGLYAFQWTPSAAQAGEWIFNVEVSDGVNITTRPITIVVQDTSDDSLLQVALDLVDRAGTDLESARALLDLVLQNSQLNAEVVTAAQHLVADLEASREYFESVSEDLQDEDPV